MFSRYARKKLNVRANPRHEICESHTLAYRRYPNVFSMNMPTEKTTTIRMGSRTLKRVDGLANAMSRSRAWVINQAVERYLDYEEWFVSEVKQALKEAERGRLLDHETVVKRWERKRAAKVDARR
jgi:predicted transcriptional regulator